MAAKFIPRLLAQLRDVDWDNIADGEALVRDGDSVTGGTAGGGGGAPSGAAGGVLGGTYPDPGFAADMATQAELDTHAADTTAVHGITDTTALETTSGAQAKVDAAVASLINSAPGALDTLDELAAALGDDANYAATITTALAGKQPLDSDLTAIAALTTTPFGRALLALADQAALLSAAGAAAASHVHSGADITSGTVVDARIDSAIARDSEVTSAIAALSSVYQPLDSDLTSIAALTTTSYGRAFLALADAAAGRTALGLGTLATQSGTFSGTSSGTNTGDQTAVSGNAGTATALATARNIDGQAFDGTAAVTVIAPGTHAATTKATPIDADELPLVDSAASNVLKKLTWANVKATLKTYFDTLYPSGSGTSSGTNTGDQTISDATITTTDITTNNVSTSKHGFAPKAPNDATKYLDGTGAYSVPPPATGYTTVTKAVDESVASNTTTQNDDELFFTATAGQYDIEIILIYGSPVGGGTPDLKVDFGEDSSIRGSFNVVAGYTAADGATVNGIVANQTSVLSIGTAATDRMFYAKGAYTGAGGTFRVRWAQATSGVNATIVRAGSQIRYRKVL